MGEGDCTGVLGPDLFLRRAEIFLSEAESHPNFATPPTKISATGAKQTRGGWAEYRAEYLTITKERLVLATANYAPHESSFHQG